MAQPNQNELAEARTRALFTRSLLTPGELVEISRLSLNTVKKVLFGKGAHHNSVLRIERSLEDYIRRRDAGTLDEHSLKLTGVLEDDAVTIAKRLAVTLQELVLDNDSAAAVDKAMLQRLIKSCEGNLNSI